MKKILITGGAGFIGREVVKQCLQEKYEVIIYDNFSFGKIENIKEFIGDNNFSLIVGNINEEEKINKVVNETKPDVCIHLAALHFIPFCNTHPLDTLSINVNGTYSVFNACVKNNVKKILFASSGALYESVERELVEQGDLPKPVDIYGCSKLLGEQVCEYFTNTSDVSIIAMRLFNTYGPFETNPHVIPEIIGQLKQGGTVKLGNVETKRDYIYTEDIAKAIIKLAETEMENKFEVVNIGTGVEYSVAEIIEEIGRLLGKKIIIEKDPMRYRKSDKMHQIASLKKISRLTKWKSQNNLHEGLKKLLKHEGLLK